MGKTRVFIVDDAVVVRRLVSDVLAGDPALEVVGCAANGRIALAKIPQVNPDVVTLDVEMPEMDGLETLAALRKTHPRLPVIMFSALTHRGAAATFHALTLGATDYVAKPANLVNASLAVQHIRDELIPRIKLLGGQAAGVARRQPPQVPGGVGLRAAPLPRAAARVEIVAVGVSTGGPNALSVLLAGLPAQFPVPVLIVQHMPPMFTRLLAERLAAASALTIHEGTSGALLEPGQAWLAPGDYHMVLAEDARGCRLRLHQGPLENSCRPSVDVLFRAVAEAYGPGVLGVVLTGMGQDGLRGCERIRDAGGQVLVQDEATSVVWGMPGFVARAGLADQVLPLDQLAPAILERVRRRRSQLFQAASSPRAPGGAHPPGAGPG
jgi:two-component system chemotaxis response regulator CheB